MKVEHGIEWGKWGTCAGAPVAYMTNGSEESYVDFTSSPLAHDRTERSKDFTLHNGTAKTPFKRNPFYGILARAASTVAPHFALRSYGGQAVG